MPYPNLYRFAETLAEQWINSERVDFEKAKDLLSDIINVPETDRTEAMQSIIKYATATRVWSKNEVARWPQMVMEGLLATCEQYDYRPDGEHWEVYGINGSGEECWIATVSTLPVAQSLTRVLGP